MMPADAPFGTATPGGESPRETRDGAAAGGTPAEEGLRERKKRETRQRISDVATEMFMTRGYEAVTISEIAAAAGVSEKTVYNYFPNKESLVLDHADEQQQRLLAAVREREPGSSAVFAFTGELKAMLADMSARFTEENSYTLIALAEMIHATPALRAAAGEHRHRMVDELTQVLAANYRIDPREPEIVTAARAIVSLLELSFQAQLRHVEDGLVGAELQHAVEADIDRGARLIATGLWSLQVLVDERRGAASPGRDSGFNPEQARQQVLSALRDAKRAWRQFSEDALAAGREIHEQALAAENGDYSYVKELARCRAQELKQRALQLSEAHKQAARKAAREARRTPPRTGH